MKNPAQDCFNQYVSDWDKKTSEAADRMFCENGEKNVEIILDKIGAARGSSCEKTLYYILGHIDTPVELTVNGNFLVAEVSVDNNAFDAPVAEYEGIQISSLSINIYIPNTEIVSVEIRKTEDEKSSLEYEIKQMFTYDAERDVHYPIYITENQKEERENVQAVTQISPELYSEKEVIRKTYRTGRVAVSTSSETIDTTSKTTERLREEDGEEKSRSKTVTNDSEQSYRHYEIYRNGNSIQTKTMDMTYEFTDAGKRIFTDGNSVEVTGDNTDVSIKEQNYEKIGDCVLKTTTENDIITQSELIEIKTGKTLEKTTYDYDAETETYTCRVESATSNILIRSEVRDSTGELLESKEMPIGLDGKDIEKVFIYNDTLLHNEMTGDVYSGLYACEYYRDGELVGVAKYDDIGYGNTTITTINYETGELHEFHIEKRRDGSYEVRESSCEAIKYNTDTKEMDVTYKDDDGRTRVFRTRPACDNDIDVKVRYQIRPCSDSKTEMQEKITASGDSFREKCVHIGNDLSNLIRVPITKSSWAGTLVDKPISGLWASISDKASSISQWYSFKSGLPNIQWSNKYVSTFNLAPDARICMCKSITDLYRLTSLYPLQNYVSPHSQHNNIPRTDWAAVAKDFDVLIVDTRDASIFERGYRETIDPYDIETSIVVFNIDVIENLEITSIEEYAERIETEGDMENISETENKQETDNWDEDDNNEKTPDTDPSDEDEEDASEYDSCENDSERYER